MEAVSNDENTKEKILIKNSDEAMDTEDSTVNSIGDGINESANSNVNEPKIVENNFKDNVNDKSSEENAGDKIGNLNNEPVEDNVHSKTVETNAHTESKENNVNEKIVDNSANEKPVNNNMNNVPMDDSVNGESTDKSVNDVSMEDVNSTSKADVNESKDNVNIDLKKDVNDVSASSKEDVNDDISDNAKKEDILPFQTLAVELEEQSKQDESVVNDDFDSSENIVITASSQKSQENTEEKCNIPNDSTMDKSLDSLQTDEVEIENMPLMPETVLTQEPATSYLEDFLFSAGGSSHKQDSDSTSCDEKGLPLRKFPQIVKGVESADYEVLQALYLILYLRNAWDTESILVQRILDFSGFDCDQDSEDFYTRKLNLCTLSNEMLNKIKILLQVPAIWPSMSTSEEAKLDAVQRILAFLQKPAKKRRQRRRASASEKKTARKGRGRPAVRKAEKSATNSSFMSVDPNFVNTDTSFTNTSFTSQDFSESNDSTDVDKSDKVGLYNYKPGPLSFKLKASGLSESEIIEIEKSLKENLAQGKASQVKIILEKLDHSVVMEKDKIKELIEKELNLQETSKKSKRKSKIPEKPFAQIKAAEKASESDDSSKNKINQEKEKSKEIEVNEKADKQNEIIRKEDEVAKKAEEKKDEKVEEDKSKDKDVEEPLVKKKLKEFQLVLSCIEGTPDKLLKEIYHLLFLKNDKQEIEEIKECILEFDGFSFDEKSDEYKRRHEVLKDMTENMVKDIARALYLDPKMDKVGTEQRLLEFLQRPKESLLRPTVIAPGMLADCDIDFEGLSDSDDSIIMEVVEKKVECVDLLSSGEEDEASTSTTATTATTTPSTTVTAKATTTPTPAVKSVSSSRAQSAAAQQQHQAAIAQLQAQNAAKRAQLPQQQQPSISVPSLITATPTPTVSTPASTASTPASSSTPGGVRTLRDFVTIKKIVETHPNEYLVDIYNLLYMQNCQDLDNLRKDILDFSGFDFNRTSPEFTKRKLYLDRMLYNSVRRIYNTLIHNTREVKVFSKPTMIGEIFQFLLELPDHDTSIPPPRPTPVVKTYSNYANVSNIIANQGLTGKEQTGKLSDLKRVFQRVACFPCEYLVDVHKLLFMTDCEMKDIRANIFAFKGFNFAIGSPEFNQRKMFLEYLTFHSLRKISSVLTTKTVDMRNSTKHELASHLTEVLKEYTTLKVDDDDSIPKPAIETAETAKTADGTAVEQIVITPILPPIPAGTSQSSDRDVTVSSSTSENSSSVSKSDTKTENKTQATNKRSATPNRKGVDPPRTDSPSSSTPTIKKESQPRPQLAKRTAKEPPEKKRKTQSLAPKSCPSPPKESQNMQFADINLPDIEKYRQIYKSNLNISMLSSPSTTVSSGPEIDLSSINAPTSTTLNFQPEFMYQQVGAGLPMMNPSMGGSPYPQPGVGPLISPNVQLPIINSFQQQLPLQNSTFFVQSPSYLNTANSDVTIPVECVLQEGKPGPKRFKQQMLSKTDQSSDDAVFPGHVKEDNENPSSSIQLKIRDAMIKTGDDEEDCDKPLATLVGHPNDKVLKQQICEIVEKTDLQDISMNGVIQKIFNMYPKYDLNYRKEFIKSTLRSLLYQLGEQQERKKGKVSSTDVDSSVSASKRKSRQS